MRLHMGYPGFADEMTILANGYLHYDSIPVEPVLDSAELCELQNLVQLVFIEDTVLEYLLKCIIATREDAFFTSGISTRGALALKTAAQAMALYHGRSFVLPEDIRSLFVPVCAHRLTAKGSADFRGGENSAQVTQQLQILLEKIPAP